MGKLAKRIRDRRVLGLIRRYLDAGVMVERQEGTPQGGPLSPLLANVLLDEVDKELERRGHASVRYADDANVYVRSRRAGERVVKLRVAGKALTAMKDRVRRLTGRSRGRSINQIISDLQEYLPGWKQYFGLAETPGIFAALDQWIRRRLRAVHLKHWKRGRKVFRELRARGASVLVAATVAANARRWWYNARLYLHTVLTTRYFDGLGLPRLQP